jgi:tetratricopeptide (TPR) repeat protein
MDLAVMTVPHIRRSPFRVALLASALLCVSTSALAQVGRYDPAQVREHHKKVDKTTQPDAQSEQKYPDATRVPPKTEATKAGGKALNDIIALYQAKQYPQATAQGEGFASGTDNAYEKSFAYQLAATAAVDAGDRARALADYRKAIDANGLGNNEHYQIMYNLAVLQLQSGQSADALATVDRLMTETKASTPEFVALKANALTLLKRPQEAIALYEQQLAQHPDDPKVLINAAAAYQAANQQDKATALLARAQAAGSLSDASQYRALYVGYLNAGKTKEALAAIDAGLAKGILQPSPELAQAYSVMAQNAYASGDTATAIAMYQRAAAISTDGEATLNLARVYYNERRMPEARKAAQEALQKGVKNVTEAKRIAAQKGK